MNIQVEKKDICLIGHTTFCKDGNTAFICSTKHNHIEYILLRNILKCFGDYKIVDTYEKFENEDDLLSVTDRVFVTDLPYSIYSSIHFHFLESQ
jgi:hypothetical protein